nr:hypothetical protein [Tanacetum cinerariifolium]
GRSKEVATSRSFVGLYVSGGTAARCCYHTSGWSASHGQPNIVPGGVGATKILVSNEMLEPGYPIRKALIGWGLGLRMVRLGIG